MRLTVVVCVAVLALAFVAIASADSAVPGMPGLKEKAKVTTRPVRKACHGWGCRKLAWLRRELAEARRDRADARAEIGIVDAWASNFVKHRRDEFNHRIRNRKSECQAFAGLLSIRRSNLRYHYFAHRRLHRRSGRKSSKPRKHRGVGKPRKLRQLQKKFGKQKGLELFRTQYPEAYKRWRARQRSDYQLQYRLRFSNHARMLAVSRTRKRSAKVAVKRCARSVKRLRSKKAGVLTRSQRVAAAARKRARKHQAYTRRMIKKIKAEIADLLRKMKARHDKYKKHYFHKCRRSRKHRSKFFCHVSLRSRQKRRGFRFLQCFWKGANSRKSKYVCYK